jgi:hypothetical protein
MNSILLTQSDIEQAAGLLALISFTSIFAGLLVYDFFRFVMRCIGCYYQIEARIRLKIREIRRQRSNVLRGQSK